MKFNRKQNNSEVDHYMKFYSDEVKTVIEPDIKFNVGEVDQGPFLNMNAGKY